VAPRITILVPPSEGKAVGGDDPPWAAGASSFPALDDARARVARAAGLRLADEPTMPAIERYTGVLYRELDWAGLPGPAKRRARSSLLVFSGLWGAVAPQDPIPYYKLKMSASVGGLGRLSTWWRPHLDAALAPALRGRVVWDLLPQEHAAAWSPASSPCRRRIVVRFVDRGGATVSHWNKLLKGALVRHLLVAPTVDPLDLAGWAHPAGYHLDVAASDLDGDPVRLVFREGYRH
jgi:cytoplasmic iron level regulating protein YaaA (DUF328/UPF0246 family)